MSGLSKEAIKNLIKTDLTNIQNAADETKRNANMVCNETLEYFSSLLEQIPLAISGPLIPKTPKVPRKKDVKRIETIPEDCAVNDVSKVSTLVEDSKMEEEEDAVPARASRRMASQKANANMKKQNSMSMVRKLRRPSSDDEDEEIPPQKTTRPSRVKRTKSVATSSDEEEVKRPSKYSKTKQRLEDTSAMKNVIKTEPVDTYVADTTLKEQEMEESVVESTKRASRNKRPREMDSDGATTSARTSVKVSSKKSQEPLAKKANVANETMEVPGNMDVTVEPSLYEDAVGKSIPMNSTMNPNTTVTIDRKMMNVTVVLEPIPMSAIINETMTIKKSKSGRSSRRSTLVNEEPAKRNVAPKSPQVSKNALQSKNNMQDRMKALKETMANNEFDALITEDESSPERIEEREAPKKKIKPEKKKQQQQAKYTRSSLTSDDDDIDEVVATPPKTVLRDVNGLKSLKNAYKANALFSPYAKDSVKKRVEAFEQAGLNSPKNVDADAPTRVTRTKTRAMAAAEAGATSTQSSLTDAQKAARKSLAKAKKISLMKQMRDTEEGKENNVISSAQKPSRLLAMNDKLAQKQQQRTTPVGKSRLQMPMSVNRIYHTPAGAQPVNSNSKALTASRANIITSVDSFLAPPKSITKSNSNDNLAEKKRKLNDEDARRKRDEALKAVTEEKRRKREEKEMKNKLAREAKEKLDMEKRLKQEREREEKARVAQLLQEKQREEFERKRLLQLQRAQEKEERRRQEEQLRQLRLQEQEEAERQLAEQKRREQEAERRRLVEARAQQLAAAEAARMKAHYLAKAKLAANKNQQGPTSYKLDSDPDDDDASDDESRPKHVIPYWALPNIRKTQLTLQEFIPLGPVLQFFGAQESTPDLTELFKGIKKERLQRTSSAIWKPPPRYSMMVDENE